MRKGIFFVCLMACVTLHASTLTGTVHDPVVGAMPFVTISLLAADSSLVGGAQLKTMLEGTDCSTIDRLEIITQPPAKYDAAGQGGIINIKTKRNKSKGFNGSLSGSYGGMYWRDPKHYMQEDHLSLSLHYRGEKTYISASLSQQCSDNIETFRPEVPPPHTSTRLSTYRAHDTTILCSTGQRLAYRLAEHAWHRALHAPLDEQRKGLVRTQPQHTYRQRHTDRAKHRGAATPFALAAARAESPLHPSLLAGERTRTAPPIRLPPPPQHPASPHGGAVSMSTIEEIR